ncbi:MAG: c-type cytochrome biogenesis protein CcmI, partial [Gammaproteobacteria bacterium]
MNITFWILTILMLLVAIGLLVYPILRVRQSSTIAYKDSNLNINDEKIKELDLDLAEGRIDQLFYKAAREELDRELLIDIPAESRETAALHYAGAAKRHPALALIITIFVPASALLLYLDLGMPSANDEAFIASQKQSRQPASAGASAKQAPSMEQLTKQLEARIEQNGGSVQDWTMLARAHKYLGQYGLAEKSFAVALQQDENNAQLMLELAEMMALNNDRKFSAESRELVNKAYALEPNNANVLWFSGVAEYQFGNYRQAIDRLTALLPIAAGEEEVVKSATAMISNSRQQLIAAGEEMPELEVLLAATAMIQTAENQAGMSTAAPVVKQATAKPADVASSSAAASSITSLSVTVNVSDEVRKKFKANDVIFVYAKAKQGPRMPLAAQRMTLAELPATVLLDDSMAMMAGMNLSAFEQLVISA